MCFAKLFCFSKLNFSVDMSFSFPKFDFSVKQKEEADLSAPVFILLRMFFSVAWLACL